MERCFEKPISEIVLFNESIITTSGCVCDVGGFDFGGCNGDGCPPVGAECTCSDEPYTNCVTGG